MPVYMFVEDNPYLVNLAGEAMQLLPWTTCDCRAGGPQHAAHQCASVAANGGQAHGVLCTSAGLAMAHATFAAGRPKRIVVDYNLGQNPQHDNRSGLDVLDGWHKMGCWVCPANANPAGTVLLTSTDLTDQMANNTNQRHGVRLFLRGSPSIPTEVKVLLICCQPEIIAALDEIGDVPPGIDKDAGLLNTFADIVQRHLANCCERLPANLQQLLHRRKAIHELAAAVARRNIVLLPPAAPGCAYPACGFPR